MDNKKDMLLSELLSQTVNSIIRSLIKDVNLFNLEDFQSFERENQRCISAVEFLYFDNPFRIKSLDYSIAKALLELQEAAFDHVYDTWNNKFPSGTLALMNSLDEEFVQDLSDIYYRLQEQDRLDDYPTIRNIFDEDAIYAERDDCLIPYDHVDDVLSSLESTLNAGHWGGKYTVDQILDESTIYDIASNDDFTYFSLSVGSSPILKEIEKRFFSNSELPVFPRPEVIEFQLREDNEDFVEDYNITEDEFNELLEERNKLIKDLLKKYPNEFEYREVIYGAIEAKLNEWFEDWEFEKIPKDLRPSLKIFKDSSLEPRDQPFEQYCRVLNKDITICETLNIIPNVEQTITTLVYIPEESLFSEYEVLGGELYTDRVYRRIREKDSNTQTLANTEIVVQDFSEKPFFDTRPLSGLDLKSIHVRNLNQAHFFIFGHKPTIPIKFETQTKGRGAIVIQAIDIAKNLDTLGDGFTLTQETHSQLCQKYAPYINIQDPEYVVFEYNLYISNPDAAIILKVTPSNNEEFEWFQNNFIKENANDAVSIIYLINEDVRAHYIRTHHNFSHNKKILKDYGFSPMDVAYVQFEQPIEDYKSLRYAKSFIESIGFKDNGDFHKNSNFIAYSYLYMMLPQIVGRFAEHLQDDKVSQKLPLGLVIDAAFESKDIDSPAKFLKEAYTFSKFGKHPLEFSINDVSFQPLKAFEESTGVYKSFVRYLYSFIDLYTKPLVLLYNAHQFSTPARQNPYIFKEQSRLACNYGVDFSNSSWVSMYFEALNNSQSEEFASSSILTIGEYPSLEQVEQEIERFIAFADVDEFHDIEKLENLDRTFFKADSFQLNERFSKRDYNLAEDFLGSLFGEVVDHSIRKERTIQYSIYEDYTIFSAFGEFQNGKFNQMLTQTITFLSRFASYTLGTLIVNNDFSKSDFFTLFLSPNSVSNVILHKLPIGENILEWLAYDSNLKKIVKNNLVNVRSAGEEARVPICYANVSKNIIPYELIRRFLLTFKKHKPFSIMGKDSRLSAPPGDRLRLGAFVGLVWLLKQAQTEFLNIQDPSIYGPIQCVGSTYEEMKDRNNNQHSHWDNEDEDEDEGVDFKYAVRQATASRYSYGSTKFVRASADDIRSRFVNLTSAYSICIGQSGMGYIKNAQDGELDVFTLFDGDTNISTIGFNLRGDIVDQKGGNNSEPYNRSIESIQFMLNWLFDLFFGNCVSEEDFVSFLREERDKFTIDTELDFKNSSLDRLFEKNKGFIERHQSQLSNIGKLTGLCTRLQIVLEENFDEDTLDIERLTQRILKFDAQYSQGRSVFASLLNASPDSNLGEAPLSLLENGVVRKAKAHF